jgi:uncharacterized protein
MLAWLENEWTELRGALRRVHWQAAVVLVAATVLVLVQLQIGGRPFYWSNIAERLDPTNQQLGAWAWWFSVQGITGFLVPVLILVVAFKRKPSEIGLGLGDWKLAGILALLYMIPVTIGTWVLSDGADFQHQYPHHKEAAFSWQVFGIYHVLFLFYWIGWEYLWRGFVLFGTAPAFGLGAIFVQMVPFAVLHAGKPAAEAYLSILGGLLLAAVVWRCRSFWIAVPIHAFQMLVLDFWVSLRLRTGASGWGFEALREAFRGLG